MGLDQVALDVVRLLLGHAAQNRRITFRNFSSLVRLAVVIASVLHLWSLIRLLRRPARSRLSGILALIGEVAVPFAVIWRAPKLADSPWSLLRWYVPDLFTRLSAMGLLSLGKTLLRIMRFFYWKKKNE